MILAIDVGNTNIVFGGVTDGKTAFISRIGTDKNKTADEYAVQIKILIELNGLSAEDFEGGIVSSVVPQLNEILKISVKKVIHCTPMIVGPGIKTGLNIKIDNPAQLGSDLVVGAVAAVVLYPKPLMVIDMGTATTICVVDKDSCYRGGVIIPGVKVSMESLTRNAAQLQGISIEAPKKAIGTNTIDCMRSGTVFGNAAMLDGLIDRMSLEIEGTPTIIATGGLSPMIVPHCRHEIILNDELLLYGLEIIYKKNIVH